MERCFNNKNTIMNTESKTLSEIMHEGIYDTLNFVCEESFLIDAIAHDISIDNPDIALDAIKGSLSNQDKTELVSMAYDLIASNSANAEKFNSFASVFSIDSQSDYQIDTDDYRKYEQLDRLMLVDMFVTGNSPLEVRDYYDGLDDIDVIEIFSKLNNSHVLSDETTLMILNGLNGAFEFKADDDLIELEEKVKEQIEIFHKMIKDFVLKEKMIKKMLDSNRSVTVTL